MDLGNVKSLRIRQSDWMAIASGATNNPIAEGEILDLFVNAKTQGKTVFIIDDLDGSVVGQV
jgi:hypothetical protein